MMARGQLPINPYCGSKPLRTSTHPLKRDEVQWSSQIAIKHSQLEFIVPCYFGEMLFEAVKGREVAWAHGYSGLTHGPAERCDKTSAPHMRMHGSWRPSVGERIALRMPRPSAHSPNLAW